MSKTESLSKEQQITWAGIVKTQRALSSSDGNVNKVLIYDENGFVGPQEFEYEQDELEDSFGDKLKVYRYAYIDGNDNLYLGDVAPDHDW